MAKKEITYRPMYGFKHTSVGSIKGADITIIRPPQSMPDADKDELIRQLRASLALLEAKEAKRKAQTRERTRKARAKK